MNRWLDVLVAVTAIALYAGAFAAIVFGLGWLMDNGYAAHVGWTIAISLPVLLVARFWEGLADFGQLIRAVIEAIRSEG